MTHCMRDSRRSVRSGDESSMKHDLHPTAPMCPPGVRTAQDAVLRTVLLQVAVLYRMYCPTSLASQLAPLCMPLPLSFAHLLADASCRRAAALRPTDARMWCALGQCYVSEQVRDGGNASASGGAQRFSDLGRPRAYVTTHTDYLCDLHLLMCPAGGQPGASDPLLPEGHRQQRP